MMFRVAENLIERGTIRITDEIFHASEPYSVFGLGTSLAFAPSLVVGKALGLDPRFLAALTNAWVTAATGSLAYAFGRLLADSHRRGVALAILFGAGTIAWPYAKSVFSEPLIGLLIGLTTYCLIRHRQDDTRPRRWLIIAGLALGYAVLTREDTAATVPIFLLYVVHGAWFGRSGAAAGDAVRVRLRDAGIDAGLFLGCLAPFLVAALTYHALRFGSLLSGFLDRTGNTFLLDPAAVAIGVFGLTLSSGKGLVFFSPLSIGGIAALPAFARSHRAEAVLIAAIVVERILLFGSFSRWFGGWGWGPRYLVPLGLLLLLPIVTLPARRWRHGLPILALAVAGLVVQIAGVAVLYVDYLTAALDERDLAWSQLFYAPFASPIVGHIEFLLAGRDIGFLVPLPDTPTMFIARWAVAAIGVVALATAIERARRLDRMR